MENEYLCFIKHVGTDSNETNIYELLFTKNIEEFWGENFEYQPSCLCNELIPNDDGYNLIKTLKTSLKLDLIQESCCFSFQDAMDGIVAIAWENISDYEEYPEEGRLVFTYGMPYDEVEEILVAKNEILTD